MASPNSSQFFSCGVLVSFHLFPRSHSQNHPPKTLIPLSRRGFQIFEYYFHPFITIFLIEIYSFAGQKSSSHHQTFSLLPPFIFVLLSIILSTPSTPPPICHRYYTIVFIFNKVTCPG
eukprot:Sdes_comp18105_c0_seq1m7546